MKDHDEVNHPVGYTSHPSGIECIEVTRHMNFNCGNAVKYIWRNGIKPGANAITDLEKAIWYLQDEVQKLRKGLVKQSQEEVTQPPNYGNGVDRVIPRHVQGER